MVSRSQKHRAKADTRAYRCSAAPLRGHRYADIGPRARRILKTVQKQTKRRAYVRSAYFNKDKIFLSYFWEHMMEKMPSDRVRRLRFLPCALELLRKSYHDPITFLDPTQKNHFIHKFLGVTKGGESFWVLVKENRKSNKKQLLSLFPQK